MNELAHGRALADAGVTPQELTAITVTNRPGMVGGLLVGIAAAKALAWRFDRPPRQHVGRQPGLRRAGLRRDRRSGIGAGV